MTFNVELYATGDIRDQIKERIKEYTLVLISENDWFNGNIGGIQIRGLGFQSEEERLMFILEYKTVLSHIQATEKSFKWGYDPNDLDF